MCSLEIDPGNLVLGHARTAGESFDNTGGGAMIASEGISGLSGVTVGDVTDLTAFMEADFFAATAFCNFLSSDN